MSDCYLRGNCPCQSGACGTEPDDGCPVFRYFDELILRQRERMTPIAYWHGINKPITYQCRHCRTHVEEGDCYCSGCGRRISFDEYKDI
jgi:hypothetical protein